MCYAQFRLSVLLGLSELMSDIEQDVLLPPDAVWVALTDELLASQESEEWVELAQRFEPLPHEAGEQARDWLRAGVDQRRMPLDTYAVRTREDLLGFYAVTRASVDIPRRAWPLLELRRRVGFARRPQPGLILSSITRSALTPAGFGAQLFENALGLALSDRGVVALFVEPVNDRVSQLWQQGYHFRPMDFPSAAASKMLWFPVDPAPAALWP